jgi:hypothetical protein
VNDVNIDTRKIVALVLSLLTLFAVFFAASAVLSENLQPSLVLRVDDIQDFAFRDGQFFLLNWSRENNLPLSLAVITGMFGEDLELVNAVKLAVRFGSEVGVHGWKHEDLAGLEFHEQMHVLFQAKNRIKELLGLEPKLLVPPGFSFNEATVSAMREESYRIISTCVDYHDPSTFLGIRNIPATVEASVLVDGVWKMKSPESLIEEIEESFDCYGYTVIVTHPQEFISNGTLVKDRADSFVGLLNDLSKTYRFTTFDELVS